MSVNLFVLLLLISKMNSSHCFIFQVAESNPQIKFEVLNIFKEQKKPYISSKYVDDAMQNVCPHYNTPRESLSEIFKKHNRILYDKDKYVDNTQIQPNSAQLSVPDTVNDIRREIEIWEQSMFRQKCSPEIYPQWVDLTRDNIAIDVSKSHSKYILTFNNNFLNSKMV